ncbi:MAG: DUF4129 domain-containing protein [Prevotella sp.]|nr:DUF4129 domain-containing protein [Prevotella sp.]
MSTDTLQLDTALINTWRDDPRYDYDRELTGGSQNLLEWLSRCISDWLGERLGMIIDSKVTNIVLVCLGVVLILLFAWLVMRRRHAVVGGAGETGMLNYELEEDTIYGIDFAADLAQMVAEGNWRQAIRLVYLHTLKQLSDAGRIDWQPSKTPAQYVGEVGSEPFAALSRHFVRVRYGNFGADEQLFHEMQRLQTLVVQQKEEGGSAR